MTTPINMPQLGESVAEGTIGRWLKRPGEAIAKDEPLAEIITDKVNAELPSPVAGQVEALLVEEGATVGVGTTIARIAEGAPQPAGAVASGPAGAHAPEGADEPTENVGMFAGALDSLDGPAPRSAAPMEARAAEGAPTPSAEAVGERRRIRTSPLVRRLAEEHHVDLERVVGTGLAGRVTKDDILSFLAERDRAPGAPLAPSAPAPVTVAREPEPPAPAAIPADGWQAPAPPAAAPPLVRPEAAAALGRGEERVPLTPMRRTIAEHLSRAHQQVPQAWTMVEVDVTGLVRWRERAREEFQRREGVDLTYLAPFVQVAVEAVKEQPLLNARWGDDHIVLRRGIHVGIAVALDDGLIVPVLRDADERNLVGIARGVADLVGRARAGTLAPSDVQGATFTVNNTGAFGSVVSVPIVPHGQTAILTMEAIVKRPVVVDDAIAIRSMLNVCLSFDHRVLDGAVVGRFLQSVKRRLEVYQPPR
jgi:2-oxoisovalerate dehydrogenase E2 component (dihydrolipoyl transacylase)